MLIYYPGFGHVPSSELNIGLFDFLPVGYVIGSVISSSSRIGALISYYYGVFSLALVLLISILILFNLN